MNEIFRMFFHRTNKYMYSEKTFAVIEKICFLHVRSTKTYGQYTIALHNR